MKKLMVVLFLLVSPAFAATLAVGTCDPSVPSYSSIQAAVNAASVGDTVEVCSGLYTEAVTITKALNLIGKQVGNSDRAVIQGVATSASIAPLVGVYNYLASADTSVTTISPQMLVQNTGPVNITNVTVDGAMPGCGCTGVIADGIYYQNSFGTLDHSAVIRHSRSGVWVENDTASTLAVTVSNSNSGKVVGLSSTFGLVLSVTNNVSGLIYTYRTTGTVSGNFVRDNQLVLDIGSSISASQNTLTAGGPTIVGSAGNTLLGNLFNAHTVQITAGGNSNTIQKNVFNPGSSTPQTAIDFGCAVVIGNLIKQNTINDFSVGIANVPSGNTVAPSNAYFNVDTVTTSCL